MRLEYADAALRDLEEIRAYIAEDSVRSAERLQADLKAACRRLTTFPLLGRAAQGGARELSTVWPYVIVYRVLADAISIERVIHGARLR